MAAFGAGLAHTLLTLLLSVVTVFLLVMLYVLAERLIAVPTIGAKGVLEHSPLPAHKFGPAGSTERPTSVSRPWGLALTVGALCMTVVLGTGYIAPMKAIESQPSTLIIGHRGFVAGGVENTIPALEAAAKASADLVEMDVMQTKDKHFVVIHDHSLGRLAGKKAEVTDLTLAELTQT